MRTMSFEPSQKIIGLTGPSSFTPDCMSLIEDFFEANPIKLDHQNFPNIETWLHLCNAVILAGGVDIHPRTYGESVSTGKNMKNFDYRRDVREGKVIDWCLAHNIPMLGICRGHQYLGLYRMGFDFDHDICADANVVHNASRQEPKIEIDIYNTLHTVEIEDGSEYPDNSVLFVNSFHHQGLLWDKNKAKGLDAVGTAQVNSKKRIIELIINKSENWMSCQWHPEWDWQVQESSKNFLTYFKEHFLRVQKKATEIA